MNRVVVRHRYTQGIAIDLSGNRNHGSPIALEEGTGEWQNSLEWRETASRLWIAPSPTLQDLGQMSLDIEFWLHPDAPSARLNLAEGHLSFSLSINPGRGLGFSIVDAHDEWNGALTRPGIVDVATWHSVTVTHDGYGLCRIQLDGNLVAESIVPGPVRSVGPLGLSVGTWPDANEYVFRGFIRALELSTYDPWRALQEYAALKRAQSQAKPEHELAGPAAERFPLRLKSGRVQADFEPLIRMATELSRDPDAAASVKAARSELRRAAALCASYASEGSADQLRNLERAAAANLHQPGGRRGRRGFYGSGGCRIVGATIGSPPGTARDSTASRYPGLGSLIWPARWDWRSRTTRLRL